MTAKNARNVQDFVAPHCARCPFKKPDRLCYGGSKHPADCPTAMQTELAGQSLTSYQQGETRRIAQASAATERGSYKIQEDVRIPARPRILEIVEFCERMGYRRIGLVFCIGLTREAGIVARLFEAHGLEVISAICKAGGLPKTELGLGAEHLLCPENPESMCNPVLQAMLMNEAEVDFNVLLGLCVGHDSLALKHLKAPVTVLAVKDRMLGHNPLAAINCSDSYFRYMASPEKKG